MKKLIAGQYVDVTEPLAKPATANAGKANPKGGAEQNVPPQKLKLHQALSALDADIDAHWTADGLPDLNALKELTGKQYKRAIITVNAPRLTREAARKKKQTA